MLARFQAAGGVVEWQEVSDARVAGLFHHPTACPKPTLIDWDMARARQAQLGGKEMWAKYPRQMLRARVISEGIRTVYPGAISGVYTPEEVADFTVEETPAQPAATYALDRPALPAGDVEPAGPTTETVHCNGGVVKHRKPKEGVPQPDYILYQLAREDHSEVEASCWSIPAAEGWIGSTHPETYTGPLVVELVPREYRGAITYTIKHARIPGDMEFDNDEMQGPLSPGD
jgi:hypothetical protein